MHTAYSLLLAALAACLCRPVPSAASESVQFSGKSWDPYSVVQSSQDAPTGRIDPYYQGKLAQWKTNGVRRVEILIATERAAHVSPLAEQLIRRGADIVVRFDDVGYLRADCALADVESIASLPGIKRLAVELLEDYRTPTTRDLPAKSEGKPGGRTREAAALPELPADALTPSSPFVPVAEMGVRRLQRAHPTFDGRGVTIGILEGSQIFDANHPSLGARKVIGIIDPRDADGPVPDHYETTNSHSLMVASLAVGEHLGGGISSSAAPRAQVVIVLTGSTLGHDIEAWVRALRDPRISLISSSGVGGSDPFPGRGGGVRAIIVSRAIELYDKPVVVGAGNCCLVGDAGWTSEGDLSLSIGGYSSSDTLRAFFGLTGPRTGYVWGQSARGPALNGALKPDVVAPLFSLSAGPCSDDPYDAQVVYRLPRCFRVSGGTSAAAPMAASAIAALLSGLRQTSRRHIGAREINAAIRQSARFLDHYTASEQGHGLIDVWAAWKWFQRHVPQGIPEILVIAPVRHYYAHALPTPGLGQGLLIFTQRNSGGRRSEAIQLRRVSGEDTPIPVTLRWRSNELGFKTLSRSSLPLNRSVSVPVEFRLDHEGLHSAILEVLSHDGVLLKSISVTVIVATPLQAANQFSISERLRLPPIDPVEKWFVLPEGTERVKVDAQVMNEGRSTALFQVPNKNFALVPSGSDPHFVGSDSTGAMSLQVLNPIGGIYGLMFWPCAVHGALVKECPPGGKLGTTAVKFVLRADLKLETSQEQGSR